MGFFKKSVSSERKRTALTIIAKDNKILGEMTVSGKLHIDGCVEGCITSVEDVSVGKTGRIIGSIKAKNITVSGVLEGTISCEHLHISSDGRVVATVESVGLTMDQNSQFIGERRESDINTIELEKAKLEIEEKLSKEMDVIDNLPDKITLGGNAKSPNDDNQESTADNETVSKEIGSSSSETKESISNLTKEASSQKFKQPVQGIDKGAVKPVDQKHTAAVLNDVKERRQRDHLASDKVNRRAKRSIPQGPSAQTNDALKAQSKNSNVAITEQEKPKMMNENTTKLELKF